MPTIRMIFINCADSEATLFNRKIYVSVNGHTGSKDTLYIYVSNEIAF